MSWSSCFQSKIEKNYKKVWLKNSRRCLRQRHTCFTSKKRMWDSSNNQCSNWTSQSSRTLESKQRTTMTQLWMISYLLLQLRHFLSQAILMRLRRSSKMESLATPWIIQKSSFGTTILRGVLTSITCIHPTRKTTLVSHLVCMLTGETCRPRSKR